MRVIGRKALTIGTSGATVPDGTVAVFMRLPVLTSAIHTPAYNEDYTTSSAWVNFNCDDLVNGASLPETANTGSRRYGFFLPSVGPNACVRLTSACAQTATVTTVFVGY